MKSACLVLLGAALCFPGDFAEDVSEPVSYVETKATKPAAPVWRKRCKPKVTAWPWWAMA